MRALHIRKRLMSEGWSVHSIEDVTLDDFGSARVYVWFNSPKGDTQVYGCPAENTPMAWVRLDAYIKRVSPSRLAEAGRGSIATAG